MRTPPPSLSLFRILNIARKRKQKEILADSAESHFFLYPLSDEQYA